jgi:arylsulfatase A-like enzyme
VPWPEGDAYDAAKVNLPPTHIDTPETRHWRTRYYAAVTKADDDLGAIRAAVSRHLDPKNTYTFFTSDHGAQWPFGKWNLYDVGIRVPLIVAGPAVKAGATTDAMTSWVDLLPTLVDLAGGQPPKEIDGRSFAAVLRGEQETHREEIYTTHSGDGRFNVYPIRAVRDGHWKFVLNLHPEYQHATHINRASTGDGLSYFRSWEDAAKTDATAAAIVGRYKLRPAVELYDLSADPHEQRNLAAAPEHAARVSAMRAKLEAWMQQQGDTRQVFNEPLLAGQEATLIAPAGGAKKKATAK